MRDLKQTGFTDRLSTQQEAKKALLARFKPKAAAPDPEFEKLAAKRAAEKAEQEAIRAEAARLADEESEAERRGARKERKALTKAEQKLARDARYAARKARTR